MTYSTITRNAYSTLRQGDHGDEVKYLQVLLTSFYYYSPLIPHGIFESETELHVMQFQFDCTRVVDGIVGQQTWRDLEVIVTHTKANHSTLSQGSRGSEVEYLQARLNEYYSKVQSSEAYGIRIKVDGYFGSETAARVKLFQLDFSLDVDGIVGVKTWNALEHADYDI